MGSPVHVGRRQERRPRLGEFRRLGRLVAPNGEVNLGLPGHRAMRTATRSEASSRKSCHASARRQIISGLNALRFSGRFMVRCAMPSRFS